MADPLSIVALIGLALAGREMNSRKDQVKQPQMQIQPQPQPQPQQIAELRVPQYPGFQQENFTQKSVQPNFGDIVPDATSNPFGSPVINLRDRPYVSGQMNNLGPVAKELVGPGLGVPANVPSYGGFQQLYRVNPTNVGAYKLTTLPGRSGPAKSVQGGKASLIGAVNHKMPAKTAFLPLRRPLVEGRAQSMSAVVPRGNYEKSKRTTNRSETTSRADALEYAPAKSIVSALTQAQDPTRNKSDMNLEQYDHINGRAPGINSFIGGVSVTPEMRMLNSQNQGNSEQYGIRTTDKRGKAGRTANGSRMNVRADALNQGGVVTTARVDSNKYDGRMNPVNGGWSQNYTNDSFYQLNPYKGKADPRNTSRGLNIHKQQLANNPFSHSLS